MERGAEVREVLLYTTHDKCLYNNSVCMFRYIHLVDDFGGRGRRDTGDDRTSGDWRRGGRDEFDRGNSPPSSHGYGGRDSYGSSDRYERRSK